MGKFGEQYDVLIILKDHSGDPGADVNGDFDLSEKWVTYQYIETSPQSFTVTFNARRGRFMTKVPKIKKWDRLFVRLTKINGSIIEDVFHVSHISKTQIPGVGLGLKLTCPHQSSNLWKRTVSFTKTNIKLSNKGLQLRTYHSKSTLTT